MREAEGYGASLAGMRESLRKRYVYSGMREAEGYGASLPASFSLRPKHTSAYVSIRQQTSSDVSRRLPASFSLRPEEKLLEPRSFSFIEP
jgi:hypothetical protein